MDAQELALPMTRTDIALYLGMALETLSRELTCFEESGLLKRDRKKVVLTNIEALQCIARGQFADQKQEYSH